MDRPNLAPLRRGFFCGRAQLWYCLDGFAGCRNSASLFGRFFFLLGGAFSVISHALCNQASAAPLTGRAAGHLRGVGHSPLRRQAQVAGKPTHRCANFYCAIVFFFSLVGLPPRGKPLFWKILSPAPARLFRASVPLALCNRFCGSVLVWAAFPPPFSAAHMADLAPLRRGFSVAGRCATNGAARRWVVGLLCLRRDRQPCAIMRPKLSPASPGLFVCSRMVLGRNADTETKRAARR